MLGYAGVLFVSAVLVFLRYLQYVNHPADVAASSGMYAGGDWLLTLFIVGMLLVPTFLLVLMIRKSEAAYTRFSQTLLGLSLTAPASVGALFIPAVSQSNSWLGEFCVNRLFAAPMVVVGLALGRVFARFSRAKRLTTYAIFIEMGTFALLTALTVFPK